MRIRMHYRAHGRILKISDKKMFRQFTAWDSWVTQKDLKPWEVHILEGLGVM